jgi:hypothetical protein
MSGGARPGTPGTPRAHAFEVNKKLHFVDQTKKVLSVFSSYIIYNYNVIMQNLNRLY